MSGSNLWPRLEACERMIVQLLNRIIALEAKLRVAEQNQYQQRGS